MISGEAPFDAESEEELMDIIAGDDPIEYPDFFSANVVDVCYNRLVAISWRKRGVGSIRDVVPLPSPYTRARAPSLAD